MASPPRVTQQVEVTSRDNWFDDDDNLIIDQGEVLRDGYMPEEEAEACWRAFAQKAGLDRRADLVKMAVSCSAGTSAETNFEERYLDDANSKSCVARFVEILMSNKYLANRENKLRVWARSYPSFALLTARVIAKNDWLARERAAEYECDVQYSRVCFDYSDVLSAETINLSPTEKQVMKYGLRFKAREGRTAVASQEGQGVRGSAPADRGVGASILPDSNRVFGSRGSGPYA